MRPIWLFSVTLFVSFRLAAQDTAIDQIINPAEVEKIEKVLSADDMQGRATFSPGIEKAADFIETQFKSAHLIPWNNSHSYRQPFFNDTSQNRRMP